MRFIAAILQAARRARMTCLGMVGMGVLGLMLPPVAASAQDGREFEYEVKSAFLIKFAMFVQWPTNALSPDVQVPLVVGILGEDPFGAKFDRSLKTETVNGRRVEVRRARNATELLGCQIVFISASEAARLTEYLTVFRERAILTVADVPDFASQGGMIGFFKESGKVRFEINPAAIERAGLKASSKLLQVGRRITAPAAPQG